MYMYTSHCITLYIARSPVTQWVKRWPTDLVVPGSIPALGGDLFNRKRDSIAHSLSLSSVHRPDMTDTLFERT